MASAGGKARAAKLSPEQRIAISKKANEAKKKNIEAKNKNAIVSK